MDLYLYRAEVVEVHDGDTATFNVSLGFFVHIEHVIVRLLGINAPELIKGETPGLDARDYLRSLLPIGSTVTIRTVRDRREKYGRMLASIITADGANVNDLMVSTGHAVVYMPIA